jgi:WD40 repeat protein
LDGRVSRTPEATQALADRVRMLTLEGPASAIWHLGDVAAFVGDEEAVTFVGPDDAPTRVPLHAGAVLCSAGDGRRIVTGGDDGRVLSVNARGEVETLATDAKGRWIDTVALHEDGALAWSAGKTAFARTAKGGMKSLDTPSTVGALAFAPKGFRLAVAHYNGATLWFPNMAGAPQFLEWKGSHLGISFSPDGKFLVTSMQEPALHGWRLADARNMRMTGYPARVKSLSWSSDGKWLASSGAAEIICWPFQGKDGPMGKQPAILAPPNDSGVTAVACHPEEPVLIAGYGDGLVRLVRLSDGADIPLREASGAAVTAVSWNARGSRLAFALENGAAGMLAL